MPRSSDLASLRCRCSRAALTLIVRDLPVCKVPADIACCELSTRRLQAARTGLRFYRAVMPCTLVVCNGTSTGHWYHQADCRQSLRTRRLKFAVSSSKGSAGSLSKHRGELRQDFENPAMHDGEVYAWVALGRLPKPYESTTFSLQCIRLRTVRKPEITDARTLSSKPGGRLPTPTCCESAPATQPVNQSSGAQRSTEARASASVSAP